MLCVTVGGTCGARVHFSGSVGIGKRISAGFVLDPTLTVNTFFPAWSTVFGEGAAGRSKINPAPLTPSPVMCSL